MVTVTFLTNFALGFVLAAEFGQVSIEIFRRGLRGGFRQAILVSLGGTFADFIYLNIAIAGILLFLNRPEILKLLWVIGGLVVSYIAINGIKGALKEKEIGNIESNIHPFIAGFLLNFVHPINLIYWVTILGSILVKDAQENSTLIAYLDGIGIPLGVFAWWLILSTLTSVARRWVTPKLMQYISMVSSVLLLGFALWFFISAFSM